MKVKDMSPQQRAERALRNKLAKERRTYGLFGKVDTLEYLGEDDGYHGFAVHFSYGFFGMFEVRLYEKSARVYRA